MNMQCSYLTPAFGPAVFCLKSVAPEGIGLQTIFAGVLPFVALLMTGLILVLLFPQIALWLVRCPLASGRGGGQRLRLADR